jgi:hypothetical protein
MLRFSAVTAKARLDGAGDSPDEGGCKSCDTEGVKDGCTPSLLCTLYAAGLPPDHVELDKPLRFHCCAVQHDGKLVQQVELAVVMGEKDTADREELAYEHSARQGKTAEATALHRGY